MLPAITVFTLLRPDLDRQGTLWRVEVLQIRIKRSMSHKTCLTLHGIHIILSYEWMLNITFSTKISEIPVFSNVAVSVTITYLYGLLHPCQHCL